MTKVASPADATALLVFIISTCTTRRTARGVKLTCTLPEEPFEHLYEWADEMRLMASAPTRSPYLTPPRSLAAWSSLSESRPLRSGNVVPFPRPYGGA